MTEASQEKNDEEAKTDPYSTDTRLYPQFKLSKSYQPSLAGPMEQQLTADFISLFFNPEPNIRLHNWVAELPSLQGSSTYPAIRYAIRAATVALAGKLTGNTSIQMEACRWYVIVLNSQRETLQRIEYQGFNSLKESAVCVSILCSFVETILCTEIEAWVPHITAAIKLVEMLGPESCREGLVGSMFRTIREGAFYLSFATNQPSVLASEAWCSVPFPLGKTPIDRLIDICLQLPGCIAQKARLDRPNQSDPEERAKARRDIEKTAWNLIFDLDAWWETTRAHIGPTHHHAQLAELPGDMANSLRHTNSDFRPNFTLFDAVQIILAGLLRDLSPDPGAFAPPIKRYSASVLAATKYLEHVGRYSGGTVVIAFSLKVVCAISPCASQRWEAQSTLMKWSRERGVATDRKWLVPVRGCRMPLIGW